jgi:hypothetical protein
MRSLPPNCQAFDAAVRADLMRPVVGASRYFVTKDGEIYSSMGRTLRRLSPTKSGGRGGVYPMLSISGDDGRIRRRYVHRIVLESWCRPPESGEECRHLDGNPLNNRLDNLAWGTSQENTNDKFLHGTQPKGEACHSCKLMDSDVARIRNMLAAGLSKRRVAKDFGVTEGAIRYAIRNRATQHA